MKGNERKSDPVALFHQYQKMWAQNPFPGEDSRSNLRWKVRQKMMGAQKQQPPRVSFPHFEMLFMTIVN